jgi:aminoglycoside/choline kinase family phosphotransferase
MFDRAEADRFEALVDWIRRTLGTRDLPIAPASSDASFRRYYRIAHEGVTRIVMDAPPEREDCRVFADIAVRLARAGLHVPEVLAGDFGRGFLLLTDLGTRLYLDELDPRSAPALYADALHALHTMQERADGTGLPSYDRACLLREMELFRVWLLEKHLGLRLSDPEQETLHGTFGLLADAALAQPQVFVHRDYHSRNLLYTAGDNLGGHGPGGNHPGVIDFQDAVLGPVCYDLVSLLRDCYIRWPEAEVHARMMGYRERSGPALRGVDPAVFVRWFDLMGVQRHLKASGIFARLLHRDGKPAYLADVPRTVGYLVDVSRGYPELRALYAFLCERVLPALHGDREPPPKK